MTTTHTTYRFSLPRPESCTGLADWLREAIDADLQGTLDDAQKLARQFDCRVDLEDEAGFSRGWATEDDYSLR